jgi:gas vesicle protein
MDIVWGLLGGGIIGLLIAHFYYKKSKKEDEKQLDSIKKEFENLDKKVSRINIDNLPIEEQKELKEIDNELKDWIIKLNNDPGEIENKINTKRNELKNENNKKSDLLRPYVIKVLDNIDNIINTLNKTGKDITWEKPQLPANIYDSNISTKFKFNKIDRESIEVRHFLDDIHIMIANDEEKDLMKQNTVHFKFFIYDNYRIELSIKSSNEFSFINEHYHFDIEQADTIYRESLKNLFEYLVIKYSK